MEINYNNYFKYVNAPVIVCDDDIVIYENRSAKQMLNPMIIDQKWGENEKSIYLKDIIEFVGSSGEEFVKRVIENEFVEQYPAVIKSYYGEEIPVTISVSSQTTHGKTYKYIYINETFDIRKNSPTESVIFTKVLSMAHDYESIDETISQILAFIGAFIKVDRAYIFESVSETATSNTFEWCADGIRPEIENLKNLPKDEYSYDDIISNGMMITDDVSYLSEEDRAILEPQGIKAMALVPLYSNEGALGYVGFDDCTSKRVWSREAIKLLEDVANLLASLLERRNAQMRLRSSMNILQTVTDNLNNLVCVTDIISHKILFINNSMAGHLGLSNTTLSGNLYFAFMQLIGKGEALDADTDRELSTENHISWEYYDKYQDKWYMVIEEAIDWIDGSKALITSATDITKRKEYESKLEYYASTDLLTGVYSREWGNEIVMKILSTGVDLENNSLVFIDLDGLKNVNDKYGHAEGDRMIKKTLEIIRSHTRKSDILFRWGGDEFILVIRGNMEQADVAIQNVRRYLMHYNDTNELPFRLGFSYGIVQMDHAGEKTIDALLQIADRAMYEDKKNKGSRKAESGEA